MAVPNMNGSFNLNRDGINRAVAYVSPGAYILGYVENGTFYVQRTGRSDDNLNRRLHDYEGQYRSFKYAYANDSEQAFYMECELWHAYADKNRQIHPARPAGTNYACPVRNCPYLD